MATLPEIIFDIVPQEFEVVGRGFKKDPLRAKMPTESGHPKEIVFRGDASSLSPIEQSIIQGIIDGHSYEDIALKTDHAYGSVKNIVSGIGKRLRAEGFNIPSGPNDVITNVVLTLLQTGELELKDPV